MSDPVQTLRVDDLRIGIRHRERGDVPLVDGISFRIERGESVALVGESGCGKSLSASSILGLYESPEMRTLSGSITLDGRDLTKASSRELRQIRGRRIGMVFQDPSAYLDPLIRVGDQVAEPLRAHGWQGNHRARVLELLERVSLPSPERVASMYPHELSGGMRQRVLIAAALALEPDFLIADEPTTALDVTVQDEIMELLDSLRRSTGLGILLITHDLGIVSGFCDRVYVMYAGRIVESNRTRELFQQPHHPYTEGLIRSVLLPGDSGDRLFGVPGRVPPLSGLGSGCRFAPRCPAAIDACPAADPPTTKVGDVGAHACIRAHEFVPGTVWESPPQWTEPIREAGR